MSKNKEFKNENGNKKEYVTPSIKKFPPIKVSTGITYYYYTYVS